jgi:hypothetical protein
MIQSTWGPLAAAAIALVARGRLNLSDLAEARGRSLAAPWELGEDGRIQGWSPLRKSA